MKKVRQSHAAKNKVEKQIAYAILLFVLLDALTYSIVFVIGPSHMGDDIAYAFSAHYAAIGTFVQTSGNILSIRTLQIFPIAFFYKLFGANVLSSAAWDILSFILSIVLVFLIGSELYDEWVGLIAAFLLAVFPLAAVYSVTMSDNVPMMLFVNLAFFALIKAMKTKPEQAKKWYATAGIAVAAAPLTTPEGFILWVILVPILLFELIKKKITINKNSLFFAYGFCVAIALTLIFNFVNAGQPLITFTANSQYYSQIQRPDLVPLPLNTALSFYPNLMFSYGIIQNVLKGNLNPISIANEYLVNGNSVGFFFYIFLFSAAYLLFLRDKRAYLLLSWFLFGFLYLAFGPQYISLAPFTYVLSHRLDRYLLLIAAPLTIVISASLTKLVETSREKFKNVKLALCGALIAFLVTTSVPIILLINTTAAGSTYTQMQTAVYLNGLRNNTNVYLDLGYGELTIFMNFNNVSRFHFDYGGVTNCSGIPSGSYVLLPRYARVQLSSCASSWSLALSPQVPGYYQSVAPRIMPAITDLYHVG